MEEEHPARPEPVNGGELQSALSSSSTKKRITELNAQHDKLLKEELPTESAHTLLSFLFKTYPVYADRASRHAVQRCLRDLIKGPEGDVHVTALTKFLHNEASKAVIAPSNSFVLAEWCAVIEQELAARPELWKRHGVQVLISQAKILERCIGTNLRESRKHSALVVTRRGLRAVFKTEAVGKSAVEEAITILTAKGSTPSAMNAVLLGVVAGVVARIPTVKSILEARTADYYAFHTRELLGSKHVLPSHISNALHDFFSSFATQDAILKEIGPAIEKALLRAPEVVLNGLVSPIAVPLSSSVDLSELLQKHLLKPFLTQAKSSNAGIRDAVRTCFESVLSRCAADETLGRVVDELVKSIKDAKSAEHRTTFASMLSSIRSADVPSRKILEDLSPLSSREANETALESQVKALRHATTYRVSKDFDISDAATKAFSQGVADKKITVRRVWALQWGAIIWEASPESLRGEASTAYFESVLEKLSISWDEALSNPVSNAQNGLITIAYIIVVAEQKLRDTPSTKIKTILKKLNVEDHLRETNGKLSFLLNHRVYTRLTSEDDAMWSARALEASTGPLIANSVDHGPIKLAWSQAMIYMMIATSLPFQVRQYARSSSLKLFLNYPESISRTMIEGLWEWSRHINLDEKDTAAASARVRLAQSAIVVRSICPTVSQREAENYSTRDSILEEQLIKLLVLCREPLIPRIPWIQLCLHCGYDPGPLVSRYSDLSLSEIISCTSTETIDAHTIHVRQAACNAAAELAFVAPKDMTPKLVELLSIDLSPQSFKEIGPTEAAIFKTPPDVTYVDVLSQKMDKQLPDKKAKDYDTLKWEQELRDQLSQKQGQKKKLTADEQAKVKTQLAKENEIRKRVSAVDLKVRRAVGIIHSFAKGPPSDAEQWIGPAVHLLIEAIKAGAALLIGDAASLAYLSCSDQVNLRLGTMRRFIGVATLRGQGASQLPEDLEQEPLGELVTRILYRIRFTAEQRPFDSVSLSYILPLISLILTEGGVGLPIGDGADEQITLALEFLSFHSDLFTSHQLPREYVLSLLVSSMRRYNQHYKILKDCLSGISRAVALDPTKQEIEVLLRGSIVPQVSVRSSCLQAIDEEFELPEGTFCVEVWLACHDDDTENIEMARSIWEENLLQTMPESSEEIFTYLESKDIQLRRAAARALNGCVKNHPKTFPQVLIQLQSLYSTMAEPPKQERDAYGMPIKKDLADPWEPRQGVALAFKELTTSFEPDLIIPFIRFLIEKGPVADKEPKVRDEMVGAATSIISEQAGSNVEDLLGIFESTLEAPDTGSAIYDRTNEAVIIMYGALGQHLKSGDERIPKVVGRLLKTLSTPSETVQYAIAGCLPPLVRSSSPEVPSYIEQVMSDLLESKKYAMRRGGAYGLAGIIRGKGISALRELRLMSTLKAATEDKKDQSKRQGAFLAFELLSLILGPIFEPYVVQIVPQLLAGFGDSSADVREACLDAAKTCFASLSSFGVKQILPTLLEGLQDQQWRSKKGACDSLGAMAYLDPQQLAMSLPEIIPPLTTVLTDSHKEVRNSANRSLQRFGDVISNPEVKSVVNIVLKALSDPTKHTDEALEALLKIQFVHYLDSPSLALVVRILERGLSDRSSTKRNASQIIGSLAHLTERKDLISHLPILVSGLRTAAVDPVPATRATASKALGSLVEKLGEDALPDLIPSLMSTLKTDTGAGDRLGSAQALSEVLAGLGTGRLEETLPSILQNVASTKSTVREGFMSLFIFLPACFGNSFANYLNKIIPPILSGLADEVESIRDTSLRAGRLLVKNFATRAIDLLLPELQRGMADDSHRIRLPSVELVGDLLFNLTGISAKIEEDEAPEEGAQAAGQSLLEVLGEEKRNNVLSALYISRCDTSGLVRTAAINVWKALVATPRTLREITPTLTQVIVRRLASSNAEQRAIASNALGELIRKAGENVLSSLLPTLEEGLHTSVDKDAKQGICLALRELISSASPDTLEEHESKLIAIIRTALLDPSTVVREAAAEAFDSLQRMFGKKVVDQILPNLLGLLRDDDEAENALAALLTLLTESSRSNIILPNLLPTLLASPISAFNARALASLASVAGSVMVRRLSNILNALMDNIITCKDEERLAALDSAFDAVLISVDEFDGLNTAMSTMITFIKHDDHLKRKAADYHMATFFQQAKMDYSRYYADLVRVLLVSFDDSDPEVIKAAWTALSTLTSKIRKEDLESLVIPTRQVLSQVGVSGHNLPGFLLPKGINAILPIFLQGLINGSPEQRTQSAEAISAIIDRSNADALKPYVTQITGPLIRVVSERSVEVKAAILLTLNHLLEKIPTFIKPFLPQLQRTFTKSLADTSSEVLRTRAAKALGTLITLTPRIDPLIGELVTGARTSDPGVKSAMQKALKEVIRKVGQNMSETSRNSILGLIDEESEDSNDSSIITNASLLGALIKNLSQEAANTLIKSRVIPAVSTRSSVLALNAILLESPRTLTNSFSNETVSTISIGAGNADAVISENCVLAAGKYLLSEDTNKSFDVTKPIFEALASLIEPGQAIDSRRRALVVTRTVSRQNNDIVRPHLQILVPPIFGSVRDVIIPIKLSAEAAFLEIFSIVEEENVVFDKYLAGPGASLPPGQKRSMQEYFKRVATKLGQAARDRRDAEGGQGGLGLSNDEKEDEREIWSVGKVDLGETTFADQ